LGMVASRWLLVEGRLVPVRRRSEEEGRFGRGGPYWEDGSWAGRNFKPLIFANNR
jgi:hypothetical protein